MVAAIRSGLRTGRGAADDFVPLEGMDWVMLFGFESGWCH